MFLRLIFSLVVSLCPVQLALGASNPGYRVCRAANSGCTASFPIVAIDSGTEVNEWCTCKVITNASIFDVFMPTNTEQEYRQFLQNPPGGVTSGACATNGGLGVYQITADTTGLSVRGCNRLTGTLIAPLNNRTLRSG